MRLGYNTNGLAHHDPLEAIEVLASLGYRSVALTLDHGLLAPQAGGTLRQLERLRDRLEAHKMACVIETGARYLLDPWVKHEPTLMSPTLAQRQRRIDFYRYALDQAAALKADCVSIWSGILREEIDAEAGLERLAAGLAPVCEHAQQVGVPIGFEPEPGMFIDSTFRFERLLQWYDHPQLQMTLDIGHLLCQGEVPMVDYIHRWAERLVNVHLEDMRPGVHEHLMFGEGEISFPPILQALAEIRYQGGVHVELSRHSHVGAEAARQAFEFLQPIWPTSQG